MTSPVSESARREATSRIARYAAFEHAYRGYKVRDRNRVVSEAQLDRVKFNFCEPVVDFAAAWIAGQPLRFSVKHDSSDAAKLLTQAANDIWDRSFGDARFLEGALSCCIHGDMAMLARKRPDDGLALIDFVDASICYPEFSPTDVSQLTSLTVAFHYRDAGDHHVREEHWTRDGYRFIVDGEIIDEGSFDLGGNAPAVWIKNDGLKSDKFGRSEIDRILDLVLEYDHVASKETRIIDYNSSPITALTGVKKGQTELQKDLRSVWYLPENGKAELLELKSDGERIGAQLDRIEEAIQKISMTPAIAFGSIDRGFSNATGISLKILYGPLEKKTQRKRATWGPQIQKVMWLALMIEGHYVPVEHVDLVWQDAAPHNLSEALDQLETKKRLGASTRQILIEAGYDDETIERMLAERDGEDERSASRAALMFNSGGQERE